MESLKYLPKYTISDYQLWEGEWELIDGHPISMSPSPKRKHQRLAVVIATQIENEITNQEKVCGDCEVVFELDWIVNDNTIIRPDVAITCEDMEDFMTKPPVLVIEILSPSTALRDKHVKHEIYQQNGVKYYITADPVGKICQTYILTNGHYQPYESASFDIHDDCSISIDFAAILKNSK